MTRPLMQLGVGDLEALFAKSKTDVKALKQLEHELQYRQVPRAVALLAEVQAAMHGATPAAPSKPAPAPVHQQTDLWEQPARPVTSPVAASIAAPPTLPKAPQAAQPTMPVEDAYRLLKATAGSTWESIEQARRQLVQQSHPARLNSISTERRAQALVEARKVNVAYVTLSQVRCGGR